MVAPPHIVIAWPDPQLLALPKVIQPHHAICQLAQTSVLQPGEGRPRKRLKEKEVISYPDALPPQPLQQPGPDPGLEWTL